MQKWIYSCIATVLFFTNYATAQDGYADKVAKYVAQYKLLAIAEQQRCGVPAAITLGQGILETEAGCSELVSGANNHFGIKCKKEWTGETFSHTDDAPNECFRKYKCAADSYKDHSDYLKNAPRYAALFKLSPTDYPSWAIGLKHCGYATNPHYAQQLIKIIEDFKLQEYTYAAMNSDIIPSSEKKEILDDSTDEEEDTAKAIVAAPVHTDVIAKPNTPRPTEIITAAPDKIIIMNGLKAIYAYKGDMLLQYAIKYHIRYEHLLEMNDLPDAPLPCSMYIYLERKNTKGIHETHILKPGENLLQVAQLEGIQLRRLMVLNRLNIGEEPAPGTRLQLQQFADNKPMLAANDNTPVKTSKVKVKNDDDFIATNAQPVQPAANVATAQINSDDVEADASPRATQTPVITNIAKQTPEPVTASTITTPAPQEVAKNQVPTVAEEKEQPIEKTVPDDATKRRMPEPTPVSTPTKADDYIATKQPIAEPAVDKTPVVASTPTPVTTTTQPIQPAQAPAQTDDLSRLKAELDKMVYTNGEKGLSATASAKPQPTKSADAPVAAKNTKDDAAKYYTVKKGDTAFNIAKQNNITIHQLMDWNDLNFDEIKTGQRLRVKE